jgi:hypothetical protein
LFLKHEILKNMIRNYPGAFTSEEKMQINRIKDWIAQVKQ